MPLECHHIRTEFSALLDDELNTEDRELVEEHLSGCSDCLRELHGYKQVSDRYRYHHPVKAPDDFEERFRAALVPASRRRAGVPWYRYAVAAAAAITIVGGVAIWKLPRMNSAPMLLSQNRMESETAAAHAPQAPSSVADVEAAPPAATSAPAFAKPLSELEPADGLRERAEEQSAEPDVLRSRSAGTAGAAEGDASGDGVPLPLAMTSAPEPAKPLEALGQVASAPEDSPATLPPPAEPSEDSIALQSVPAAQPMTRPETSAPAEALREEVAPPDVGQLARKDGVALPARRAATAVMKTDAGDVPLEDKTENAAPDKGLESKDESDIPPARQWRKRSFALQDGIWREDGYADEPLTKIAIPSKAWNELLDRFTDLNKLCSPPEPVIVRLDKKWYEIRRAKPGPDSSLETR